MNPRVLNQTVTVEQTVSQDRHRGRRARWVSRLPLVLLAAASVGYLTLGAFEAWFDSPTFDEPVYVASGVAGLLHHDLTINDEHPPLPKVLAVLPVLLAHPVIPPNGHWSDNDERSYAARFVVAQRDAGKLGEVTFASRLVPLAESLAVAWVVFALAGELFGPAAGLLAALLWLSSPFVLGIGHLDGVDVPFALAVCLSSWALLRWLRDRSGRRLFWVGLAGALAMSTDVTGILIVATSVVVVAIGSRDRGARSILRRSGLLVLLALVGVWVPYIALDPDAVLHLSRVLPTPYVEGISYLGSHDTAAAPGYVLGVAYSGGRWWYWPVSLVVKYPIAVLVVLVSGVVSWGWIDRPARRAALAVLALPAVVLAAFTVLMPRDIGLRYLLPVLALWAAGAGALVPVAMARRLLARRALSAGVVGLVGASMVATATSFPNSLSWTSAPFRPGYAAVTNSNLDWGQGLYRLASWAEGRHPWVAYFGPRGLSDAPVPGARPLVGTAPDRVSGWVAVSATDLTSAEYPRLSWLNGFCPVGVLDGSILLYHLRRPPTTTTSSATPPPLCPGPWSRPVSTGSRAHQS